MLLKHQHIPNNVLIDNQYTYNPQVAGYRTVALSPEAALKAASLINDFQNNVEKIVENDDQPAKNVHIIAATSIVTSLQK